MRVVVVSLHLDPGGRLPQQLLASWRDFGRPQAEAVRTRAGLDLTMVLAGWADFEGEASGIPCRFVSEPAPYFRVAGRKIRRLPRRLYAAVQSLKPDLVHFEGLIFAREFHGLARALPGVPVVLQDHGAKKIHGWRRWLNRWGFAALKGAMFTAREQADEFKEAGVIRGDLPIYGVLEGSSPFTPGDREQAGKATGLQGDPGLLWLGNLDPNKDPLTVLDAVAEASRELPGLTLCMCYRRAPLLDAVRARLLDPRLKDRVRLVGEVPYPGTEPYLRAADFVVQASHAEGSGFAVIEALACGTTPLVTDIPSFRRITGDGAYGALVPRDDAGALARAIVDWSRRDRNGLRKAARARFEHALSFAAVGRELRAAYDQVLAAR